MIVLLDTNALMMPFQFRIELMDELRRLFGRVTPAVTSGVVEEIRHLADGHGKEAAAARVGMKLLDSCTVMDPGVHECVDEEIAACAQGGGCPVVTNDRELRGILLSRGITVVSLRNRQKLEILR
jgi:rRNA-processing protein FCF1